MAARRPADLDLPTYLLAVPERGVETPVDIARPRSMLAGQGF
jgi:hypothetical protein